MPYAISTRYHGPGNVRGARMSADNGDNRVSIPYNHALNADENHTAAVIALCDKFCWRGCMVSNEVAKARRSIGRVYVWHDFGPHDKGRLFIDGVERLGPLDPEERKAKLAKLKR